MTILAQRLSLHHNVQYRHAVESEKCKLLIKLSQVNKVKLMLQLMPVVQCMNLSMGTQALMIGVSGEH